MSQGRCCISKARPLPGQRCPRKQLPGHAVPAARNNAPNLPLRVPDVEATLNCNAIFSMPVIGLRGHFTISASLKNYVLLSAEASSMPIISNFRV
jgi:hypothetical protein